MQNKRIMITGGTGTVGRALIAHLLGEHPGVGEIIAYSRDEQKHYEMMVDFPPEQYPIRYVVGDVRDRDRIIMACKGIDIIVHAAAMKHVPVSEQNPIECAKTNVLGSQNVIDAAIINDVERVVALSSDKAVLPINVYGASKLYLERLFIDSDKANTTKFSVVRYANVFGSKGSVVPFFIKKKTEGYLPITDPNMTRFSITTQESLELILYAIEHGWGGEVVVPVSPSYRITDVAEAIAPGIDRRIVGKRPGEKLHEVMVSTHEAERTVANDGLYIICPENGDWDVNQYCQRTGAKPVAEEFEYESGSNPDWLNVEQIQALLAAL